jgi:hypothetical protein
LWGTLIFTSILKGFGDVYFLEKLCSVMNTRRWIICNFITLSGYNSIIEC